MKFPNAYEGMKKLVAAEALKIISAGLAIIGAVLGLSTLAGATVAAEGSEAGIVGAAASGLGLVICSFAILVLGIISEIFTLVGLKKASNDEPRYFRSAFIMAIVILIASIVSGIIGVIPGADFFANLLKTLLNVASIFVYVNTVMGISRLAKELGRQDVVSMGTTILIIEVIQLLLSSIATYTSGILGVIAAIVSFVGYIVYLVYLNKGKKMLES